MTSIRSLLLAAGFLLAPLFTSAQPADDDRPVVNDAGIAAEKAASRRLPTLWIAGDSTVKSNKPMRGWGQDLGAFFDAKKINIVNRAIGGRSSRTFLGEGRWQSILDELKRGDFVLVQFGHNDVGPLDARGKFRGSLRGTGDETEAMTKPDGSVEQVHSYGWYLRNYVTTARARGATVILCSPVPHKKFEGEAFVRDFHDQGRWMKESAEATGGIFLDLTEIIARGYREAGREIVETFFADARTHTTPAGSLFNARAVIVGLRAIPEAPLDRYLNAEGQKISATAVAGVRRGETRNRIMDTQELLP